MGAFEDAQYERRVSLLLLQVPAWLARFVAKLRHPHNRFTRYVFGGLFLLGGCLFILPFLGIWMLPIGMIILADDVPLFRKWAAAMLEWVERKHPKWLGIGI